MKGRRAILRKKAACWRPSRARRCAPCFLRCAAPVGSARQGARRPRTPGTALQVSSRKKKRGCGAEPGLPRKARPWCRMARWQLRNALQGQATAVPMQTMQGQPGQLQVLSQERGGAPSTGRAAAQVCPLGQTFPLLPSVQWVSSASPRRLIHARRPPKESEGVGKSGSPRRAAKKKDWKRPSGPFGLTSLAGACRDLMSVGVSQAGVSPAGRKVPFCGCCRRQGGMQGKTVPCPRGAGERVGERPAGTGPGRCRPAT